MPICSIYNYLQNSILQKTRNSSVLKKYKAFIIPLESKFLVILIVP